MSVSELLLSKPHSAMNMVWPY